MIRIIDPREKSEKPEPKPYSMWTCPRTGPSPALEALEDLTEEELKRIEWTEKELEEIGCKVGVFDRQPPIDNGPVY